MGDRVEITAGSTVARAVAVGEVEPREEDCLVQHGQAEGEKLEEGVEGFWGAGARVGEEEEGGGGAEGQVGPPSHEKLLAVNDGSDLRIERTIRARMPAARGWLASFAASIDTW